MTNLYVEHLYPDSKSPEKQTDHAACYDVCAHIKPYDIDTMIIIKAYNNRNQYFEVVQDPDEDTLVINPGNRMLIPTGLKVCCDEGFKVQIVPRSGLSFKQGLELSNSIGTVDADYRGELFIIFTNSSDTTVKIKHGERIAQIELIRLTNTEIMIGNLPETSSNRNGGVGSTGS